MTACAAVLACHDILAAIFDHIVPGSIEAGKYHQKQPSRKSCRKTLVSSAVVCKTISHHALNVLWRELHSVYPLLRVLPNYKRIRLRFVSRHFTFAECVLQFTKSWLRYFVVLSYPSIGQDFNSMLAACASSTGFQNTH